MQKRIAFLVVPAAFVGGCTPVDMGFGETHRWNIEQQVVDPDPEYAGEIMEGGSGTRGAAAVDRYNRGAVKQPANVGTTSGGGGGGGGGAGTTGGPGS